MEPRPADRGVEDGVSAGRRGRPPRRYGTDQTQTGTEVVTWRCSQGCALLRVFLAPAGWTLWRWWHAPETAPGAIAARRGASKSRSPMEATTLPLDVAAWPPRADFDLACRHGAAGAINLSLLAEDVRTRWATREHVTRTL